MSALKAGSAVRSVIDNRLMSVNSIDGISVNCMWFENYVLMEDTFDIENIMLVKDEDILYEQVLNSSFKCDVYTNYSTVREYLYAISSSMFSVGPEDGYSIMAKDDLYWPVYIVFVRYGYVRGSLDEDDYMESYDERAADTLLTNVFKYLFKIN